MSGGECMKEKDHIIGKSVKRVDAFEKVTGRAKYVDDLCDHTRLGEVRRGRRARAG